MLWKLTVSRHVTGGKLVFVTRDGLEFPARQPARQPGTATVHDNSIAHGVSCHSKGVRYGFFLFEGPANAKVAISA